MIPIQRVGIRFTSSNKHYQPMPMTTIVLESRDSKLITKRNHERNKTRNQNNKEKGSYKKGTSREKNNQKNKLLSNYISLRK